MTEIRDSSVSPCDLFSKANLGKYIICHFSANAQNNQTANMYLKYTTSIILAAATALLLVPQEVLASYMDMDMDKNMDMDMDMDMGNDDDVAGYCVRACNSATDDPCRDSKGQSDTCTAITFNDETLFGYTNTTVPIGFLGCSSSSCDSACSTMEDSTSTMDKEGGTFCFPKKQNMNGMYMSEDMAKLAAVGKGCSGAHFMDPMWMIGNMHSDCMESYDKMGVTYTSSSSALRGSIFMGAAASLTAFILM